MRLWHNRDTGKYAVTYSRGDRYNTNHELSSRGYKHMLDVGGNITDFCAVGDVCIDIIKKPSELQAFKRKYRQTTEYKLQQVTNRLAILEQRTPYVDNKI